MSVIVVATVFPAAGRADEVRAALLRAVPAVHEEVGCELYALHEGDDQLVLIEKWSSAQALAVHAAAPALAALHADLAGLIVGDLDIQVMTALPAGKPEAGAL